MISKLKRISRHYLERTVRNGINLLYLPERERLFELFSPVLESINARLALGKVRTYHLVTLQATGQDSDRPMKVLYAAREDVDWDEGLQYISFLLFGEDEPLISERVTCSPGQLRAQVDTMRRGCDLVCVDANRHLLWKPSVGEWAVTPHQIRTVIDFSPGESWQQVRKRLRSQRRNINLFKRAGFAQVRFSKSESDLAFFYERMYLPLVQQRYNKFAFIDRQKTLRDWQQRGELVFIIDPEGREIAGSVNINQDQVKFMMVNGVLDADRALIGQGALSSVYYHCIRIGHEAGFSRCDFGETRPFQDDGVLLHKIHWGMQILRDPWGVNRWLFWVPDGSPLGRRWLQERPFIRAVTQFGGWSPPEEGSPQAALDLQPNRDRVEPERVEDSV